MQTQITCSECEERFSLENPILGEKFSCPECGISLKVISIKANSIHTEMVEEEIEDWGE